MQGRTVRDLGDSMGSDELSEWMAFNQAYNLPDVYFMTGEVCRIIAQCLSDGKKKISAADFVPYFESMAPTQTAADQAAIFKGIAERMTT